MVRNLAFYTTQLRIRCWVFCVSSTRLTLSCLFALTLLLLPAHAQEAQRDSKQQALKSVKKDIVSQKQKLAQSNKNYQSLEQQLKENEIKIGQQAKALNTLNNDLNDTRKKIAELNKLQKRLNQQKLQQEAALAQQLRSAYASGHHDYIKLLLNQQEPTRVQRTITYYQYVNQARMESIDAFQETLAELLAVEQEQVAQAKKLEVALAAQRKQQLLLKAEQLEREKTLAKLSKRVLTEKQKLEQLSQEETKLAQALAEIQRLIEEKRKAEEAARLAEQERQQAIVSLSGLSKLKKQLNWPVKGRIRHSYGSRKQGYLKWKGVLFSANLGTTVTTIYHGTVLFADWLKGYGLVMVIDHGDGYMSLYGHNQALLKNVGDQVEVGEPIALVGQSGGQNESSLYFEVRYKGKAKNPRTWIK